MTLDPLLKKVALVTISPDLLEKYNHLERKVGAQRRIKVLIQEQNITLAQRIKDLKNRSQVLRAKLDEAVHKKSKLDVENHNKRTDLDQIISRKLIESCKNSPLLILIMIYVYN